MTAVSAQVNRDSIGSSKLADHRGFDWIRFGCLSCLAQRGDVVDIDGEKGHE
jgi:hypothetical protein